MGLVLILLPLAGVLLSSVARGKRAMDRVSVFLSLAMLAAGGILTSDVLKSGVVRYTRLGGFLYFDALSILFIDLVLVIGFLAALYSVGYLSEELKHGRLELRNIRIYHILFHSFVFTMLLALAARNIGIMWIAIEATTLASAFLVGFNNNRKALEAAWKYIIICSVGIAVALLGVIFLHLSYGEAAGLKDIQLDWPALYENAGALRTSALRMAFIFILVGFGTKAGLAPMHTWLPDAHSQAPSPISAMLSGVLLNSAMYAIIRVVSIVNKNLGSGVYSGRLLMAFGLLSVATAAIFIMTQKDYKRLLAYSSIEHMGIIALSIGIFTPASVFAAIFHVINHSLTKSMLFFSSGSVLLKYNTRQISRVKGVLKTLPVSGTAMLLGLFAIAGTPPFSVFSSELSIIAAVFRTGKYALGFVVVLLLALVFAGIAMTMFKMFFGGGETPDTAAAAGEPSLWISSVVLVLLLVISITGFFMPEGVRELITGAQKMITGG